VRADILFLPNGRSKGQGTVCFDNKEEAAKAIGAAHCVMCSAFCRNFVIANCS
jgi:hypothetical protein